MRTKIDIPASAVLVLLMLPAVLSCRKVVIDSQEKEQFLIHSEIGFYPEGTPRFIYDESTHQMCTNPSRGQFRIQTSSQDTCLNIVMEKNNLSEGETVLSQLDYYDDNLKTSDQIELECSKKDDGKMWLWDGYTKTGLIISQY